MPAGSREAAPWCELNESMLGRRTDAGEGQDGVNGYTPKVRGGLTARVLALVLVLIPLNCYWIVQVEIVRYSFPTFAVPFYNTIVTLFALTVANLRLRRVRPAWALSPPEMITLYVMLAVASALCSTNMLLTCVGVISYPLWFATPENGWADLFHQHLPKWLIVQDMEALRGYYYGYSTLYRLAHLKAWAGPVAWWTLFSLVLIGTLICANVLVRRQWSEAERLTFPIVQLPLALAAQPEALLRNRILWIGFAVAGGITLLNGLSYLFPVIPAVPIRRQEVSQYFQTMPWRYLGATNVSFYFFAIGLSFLMPLDLSFSCWVFYLLYKVQLLARPLLGLHEDPRMPYPYDQALGAYLAIFLGGAWTSRNALKAILRRALGESKELDDAGEAMRYRTALLGLVVGALLLVGFAIAAGVNPALAVVFVLLFLALSVLISRIRAELGFPVHDLSNQGPHHVLNRLMGSEWLGARNETAFTMLHWFNRNYVGHPSPHLLEGLKLSNTSRPPEDAGAAGREMVRAMLLATLIGSLASFWMILHIYYQRGTATSKFGPWALGLGREVFLLLESQIKSPTPINLTAWAYTGGGFLAALLLMGLRLRYAGFPLHPLGYAVCSGWGMHNLWVPVLIGSLCKAAVLKSGGLGGYRRAVPFFLGLVLGEFLVGGGWTLIGVVLDIPTYDFFP